MIDRAEAERVWGELIRAPEETVRGLGLTGEAAEVLVAVGLPASAEPFFAFMPPRRLTSGPGSGMVQFGTDFGSMMCVHPPDGRLSSIPDAAGGRVRAVNTDLGSFAEFLLRTCRSYSRLPSQDDDQIDREIESLREALQVIDPSAFDDPENWWSVIFEQLRDGLL